MVRVTVGRDVELVSSALLLPNQILIDSGSGRLWQISTAFSDKILILDSYENEDGQVRVLEYRSGGERIDLLAEPRISSEPAVQFAKPSLISIVYQCLSFIVMCGFVGWCLASLLWW